jgi:hypothetical protein
VGTAIVVILVLLGIGIVVDALFRMRNWLNKSPSGPDDRGHSDPKP